MSHNSHDRNIEATGDVATRLETILSGLQAVGEAQLQFTAGLFRILAAELRTSPDTFLNTREAAAKLRVSEHWMRRHSAALPFRRRVGRLVRYSSIGIEAWMKNREI